MKKQITRIFLLLIISLSLLVVVSCAVTSITQIKFVKTPLVTYILDEEMQAEINQKGYYKIDAEIEVTYSDTSKRTVDINEALSLGIKVMGEKFSAPGNYTLIVSYGSITASFEYKVTSNVSIYETLQAFNTAQDNGNISEGSIVKLDFDSNELNSTIDIKTSKITVMGDENKAFRNYIVISGEEVTLDSIRMEIDYRDNFITSQDKAPLSTTTTVNKLTINNSKFIRVSSEAQAYALLVDANNGELFINNSTFVAPYLDDKVYDKSPSVFEALGGLYMNNCLVQTNGYGIFSGHVTKGEIKNTVFEGVDNKSIAMPINISNMQGLSIMGCTFKNSYYRMFLAGYYTIKDCILDNTKIGIYGTAPSNVDSNTIIENNTFVNYSGSVAIYVYSHDTWGVTSYILPKIFILNNKFISSSSIAAIRFDVTAGNNGSYYVDDKNDRITNFLDYFDTNSNQFNGNDFSQCSAEYVIDHWKDGSSATDNGYGRTKEQMR